MFSAYSRRRQGHFRARACHAAPGTCWGAVLGGGLSSLSTSQSECLTARLRRLLGRGHRPGIRAFPVLPSRREAGLGPREASSQRVHKSLPPPGVALRRRPGRGDPARRSAGSGLRHFLPLAGAAWPRLPSEEEAPAARVTGTGAEGSAGRTRRRQGRSAPGRAAAGRGRRAGRAGRAAAAGGTLGRREEAELQGGGARRADGEPPRKPRRRGPRGRRVAARMPGRGRRLGPRPGPLGRRGPGRPACRCTTPSICESSGRW